MLIHVVQQGESIQTIADAYGVPASRLIQDNGLENNKNLVVGQSLVIAYPEITYTVIKGDTLASIANSYHVTVMQLLQNNPYLSNREYIYPGDTIIIKYSTNGKITTHGNALPFINRETLKKTLPYLTYLSILNYTATKAGEIITYYDEVDIIQMAKEYGVIPLMLLTTLTLQGEANIGIAFDLLVNEEFQQTQIKNILRILKEKGYYGVNLSLEYITVSNIRLYESYFTKIAQQLKEEGYLTFVTVNPNIKPEPNDYSMERIDYSILDQIAQSIIFMSYEWATNTNPPSPISSVYKIEVFLNYINQFLLPEKEILGIATIGYDWELPFSAGVTRVYALTLERAIDLARNVGSVIQFDEESQTPFFTYTVNSFGNKISHIVWFIDARSINAILNLVPKYDLHGIGIWNITIYNTQLWLIINSQYEIEKVI